MNIFYLDTRPKESAVMHCDKHCVKMILETAQLLCTAHRAVQRRCCVRGVWWHKSLCTRVGARHTTRFFHAECAEAGPQGNATTILFIISSIGGGGGRHASSGLEVEPSSRGGIAVACGSYCGGEKRSNDEARRTSCHEVRQGVSCGFGYGFVRGIHRTAGRVSRVVGRVVGRAGRAAYARNSKQRQKKKGA